MECAIKPFRFTRIMLESSHDEEDINDADHHSKSSVSQSSDDMTHFFISALNVVNELCLNLRRMPCGGAAIPAESHVTAGGCLGAVPSWAVAFDPLPSLPARHCWRAVGCAYVIPAACRSLFRPFAVFPFLLFSACALRPAGVHRLCPVWLFSWFASPFCLSRTPPALLSLLPCS